MHRRGGPEKPDRGEPEQENGERPVIWIVNEGAVLTFFLHSPFPASTAVVPEGADLRPLVSCWVPRPGAHACDVEATY